jgi:hypothetical protein
MRALHTRTDARCTAHDPKLFFGIAQCGGAHGSDARFLMWLLYGHIVEADHPVRVRLGRVGLRRREAAG